MARRPTLKQLKYLSAVAEHRHFGNAAKACHVSQSTLSAGILELEDALDARLAPGEAELPLTDLLDVLPAGIPLSLEVRSKHYRDSYPDFAARGRAIREQTERFLASYLSNPED